MCWYILAINHEDEISIYSRGGEKHNHEFLPYTAQPVCLCGTIQCKQQNNLRKPHIQILVFLKKYIVTKKELKECTNLLQLKHVDK